MSTGTILSSPRSVKYIAGLLCRVRDLDFDAVAGFDEEVGVEHFEEGGREGSQRRHILLSMKNDGCAVSAVIEERGLFIERTLSYRPPHMPCGRSMPT